MFIGPLRPPAGVAGRASYTDSATVGRRKRDRPPLLPVGKHPATRPAGETPHPRPPNVLRVMTSVARRRAFLGTALAAGLLVVVAGCGRSAEGEEVTSLAPPPAAAGHPAGTVTLPIGSDVPAEVKKLQDAITAGGGTVLATVDNTADADLLGVTIPPNTVVVGGAPAAGLPMLRDNQQAAAALPGRYLVTQDASGAVKLVYNGPDYVAVV